MTTRTKPQKLRHIPSRVSETPPLGLTTIEAAQALGISPRKLHDMTYPRGPIRVARAGRVRIYPVEELQRFLRDQCDEQQKAAPELEGGEA